MHAHFLRSICEAMVTGSTAVATGDIECDRSGFQSYGQHLSDWVWVDIRRLSANSRGANSRGANNSWRLSIARRDSTAELLASQEFALCPLSGSVVCGH